MLTNTKLSALCVRVPVACIRHHALRVGAPPRQMLRRGAIGPLFCPHITSNGLNSLQYLLGRSSISFFSVCSGVLVLTSPIWLEIRWTWVSTQIAGIPNASESTKLAVLGPTPLIESNSSLVLGTLPLKRSNKSSLTDRIDRALFR